MIGVVLSGVLYGAAAVQTYQYFQRFPSDNWRIKSLVTFEISIQTVHMGLMIAGMWMMSVKDFGQPEDLFVIPTPSLLTIILCSPIALAVQGFFTIRVYRLSEQSILLILGGLLAFSKFTLHLLFGIAAFMTKRAPDIVHNWGWCITSYLVISVACDGLLAISLGHHLKRRKTGFDRTSRIIDRMILYTHATGLTTSTVELAEAICFWTMPRNYIWMGLYVIESGLYTNSLLASLNSRAIFNQLRKSDIPYEIGLSNRGADTLVGSSYGDHKSPLGRPIMISVTHETVQAGEDTTIQRPMMM